MFDETAEEELKNLCNEDEEENDVQWESATPPAEPEHGIVINKELPPKKSELITAFDIHKPS